MNKDFSVSVADRLATERARLLHGRTADEVERFLTQAFELASFQTYEEIHSALPIDGRNEIAAHIDSGDLSANPYVVFGRYGFGEEVVHKVFMEKLEAALNRR